MIIVNIDNMLLDSSYDNIEDLAVEMKIDERMKRAGSHYRMMENALKISRSYNNIDKVFKWTFRIAVCVAALAFLIIFCIFTFWNLGIGK